MLVHPYAGSVWSKCVNIPAYLYFHLTRLYTPPQRVHWLYFDFFVFYYNYYFNCWELKWRPVDFERKQIISLTIYKITHIVVQSHGAENHASTWPKLDGVLRTKHQQNRGSDKGSLQRGSAGRRPWRSISNNATGRHRGIPRVTAA